MLTKALHHAGLRGWLLHGASLGSIGLCIGLWPPMFWLIGDAVQEHE